MLSPGSCLSPPATVCQNTNSPVGSNLARPVSVHEQGWRCPWANARNNCVSAHELSCDSVNPARGKTPCGHRRTCTPPQRRHFSTPTFRAERSAHRHPHKRACTPLRGDCRIRSAGVGIDWMPRVGCDKPPASREELGTSAERSGVRSDGLSRIAERGWIVRPGRLQCDVRIA